VLMITIAACVVYLAFLFALADRVARRPALASRLTSNGVVYALSLGVYATAWTFFGSVGMAAKTGNLFLAVYLGPTLAAILFWPVLGRIVRIAHRVRSHSLADFIAARYGKSESVGMVVTLIALVGTTPYLAVQLKAITSGLTLLSGPSPFGFGHSLLTLAVAITLALFVMLFGNRQLDLTERRPALVAVVALESLVKLAAFLAVGLTVTFVLFPGPAGLFSRAANEASLIPLFGFGPDPQMALAEWPWVVLVSALAVICLPRMFQMAVVENSRESHVRQASWLFPLYLLGFNLFTLAIALAGRMLLAPGANADLYVISLPLMSGATALALIAFLGGFSAATAMVIVETLALANMITNQLAVPLLLRVPTLRKHASLPQMLMGLRRASVLMGVLLAWAYAESLGEEASLVSIGLVSFLAVAQFAPALLGGLFWAGATRAGVMTGLIAGTAVWLYTMVLPIAADAGLLPAGWVAAGPFGIEWMRPRALFGADLPPFAHAAYWSLLLNSALMVAVSLLRPRVAERREAERFLGEGPVLSGRYEPEVARKWLFSLLVRVLGTSQAEVELGRYEREAAAVSDGRAPGFREFVETRLAGIVGSATANMMVEQAVADDPLHDPVTGTLNRRALVGALADRLATARDPNSVLVAVLRIDRYRLVSTGIGEQVAELLMRRGGERLRSELEEDELLARTGGDTFAVVLGPMQELATACRRMSRLQEAISPVFSVDGNLISSSASVGIARGGPTVEPEALVREAETVLEAAGTAVGSCRVFERSMRESLLETVQFEARLRQARERGELEVRYQPVVELAGAHLAGFEALLRWHPEAHNVVSPTKFIPVLESSGLIVEIGDFVLEEACRQLAEWHTMEGGEKIHVAVNLAARQLIQPELPTRVASLLEHHGLEGAALQLEITETSLMSEPEQAYRVLTELRALGVAVLLDDFGTGYSSLSYLQRFPVDTLKVDQAFVRRYGKRSSPLAEAAIAMAHSLHMTVVAEGVETRVQYDWLRRLGVECGQGYFFAPPLDLRGAGDLLRRLYRRGPGLRAWRSRPDGRVV
jgi:diguanylate cyclase (GGDEF)-like protein